MKRCSKCGLDKETTEYYAHRNACKPCERQRSLAYYRADRARGRKIYRKSYVKRVYGIDIDTYNQMVEDQGNRCKICGGSSPHTSRDIAWNIDHNHKTGEVRGLLCDKCNRGIGMFDEDASRLKNAIRYLTKEDYSA